jgi:hypothetical protein
MESSIFSTVTRHGVTVMVICQTVEYEWDTEFSRLHQTRLKKKTDNKTARWSDIRQTMNFVQHNTMLRLLLVRCTKLVYFDNAVLYSDINDTLHTRFEICCQRPMDLFDITLTYIYHLVLTPSNKKWRDGVREQTMAFSHFIRLQVVKFDSVSRYYFDIPFPVFFFIVFTCRISIWASNYPSTQHSMHSAVVTSLTEKLKTITRGNFVWGEPEVKGAVFCITISLSHFPVWIPLVRSLCLSGYKGCGWGWGYVMEICLTGPLVYEMTDVHNPFAAYQHENDNNWR